LVNEARQDQTGKRRWEFFIGLSIRRSRLRAGSFPFHQSWRLTAPLPRHGSLCVSPTHIYCTARVNVVVALLLLDTASVPVTVSVYVPVAAPGGVVVVVGLLEPPSRLRSAHWFRKATWCNSAPSSAIHPANPVSLRLCPNADTVLSSPSQ
jgi:hypothetical protein